MVNEAINFWIVSYEYNNDTMFDYNYKKNAIYKFNVTKILAERINSCDTQLIEDQTDW